MRLEEADLENEQELEYLLKKDPEQIEKGLKIIANQVPTPKGRIDLLCVDAERVLTTVELKTDQDDDQLKQSMNYYDWVFENMDWLRSTFPQFRIHDEYLPKLILVAKSFTESVIIGTKYLNQVFDIKLYAYKALRTNGEKHIICNEIPVPKIPEIPEKPKTLDDQLSYITDAKVKEVCAKTIQAIKDFDKDVEVTPKKWGLSFKYKGRNFAALYPRRESFVIDWKQEDDWYTESGIKKMKQVQSIINDNIRKSFELVSGKLARAAESEKSQGAELE